MDVIATRPLIGIYDGKRYRVPRRHIAAIVPMPTAPYVAMAATGTATA